MDWKTYGIGLVATAVNGKQGFLKYKKYCPNIIISDIKMPFMDGLEMIRQIKAQSTSVYFVILTGYSEFSYAKEAIALGANGYILKDEITEEAIKRVLDPIKAEIKERAEISSWAIQKEIQSFPESQPPNLTVAIQNIQNHFERFLTGSNIEDYDQLEHNIVEQIKYAYSHYGNLNFFEPPHIRSETDLLQWIISQLSIIHQWGPKMVQKLSPAVTSAMMFIQKNYATKNLNIQMVANEVFLSPNWLSALFKKETGQTVNGYITDVRIKKASELLLQGKYKVYEIAEMVGYGSSQYFSKVFFQTTQKNPQRF